MSLRWTRATFTSMWTTMVTGEPRFHLELSDAIKMGPPQGYSLFSTDCDDNADPDRAPSLPELCTDDIDENCDGNTILGAVDLITTWTVDTDGDGFGIISTIPSPPAYHADWLCRQRSGLQRHRSQRCVQMSCPKMSCATELDSL